VKPREFAKSRRDPFASRANVHAARRYLISISIASIEISRARAMSERCVEERAARISRGTSRYFVIEHSQRYSRNVFHAYIFLLENAGCGCIMDWRFPLVPVRRFPGSRSING